MNAAVAQPLPKDYWAWSSLRPKYAQYARQYRQDFRLRSG
jgi:hypothetical protein